MKTKLVHILNMHKNSGTRKYSKSYTVECIHKIQVHKFYPKLEADIAVRSQESVLQSTGFWKEKRTKEKKTKGWERIAKKSSSRCAHWGKHHTSKLRLRYSATNRKGASNLPTFPQFTILHSEVGREDIWESTFQTLYPNKNASREALPI